MNLESPDTTFHDLAARVTKIEFLLVAERVGREVELLDLLKTIWRRKWLIAAVTVTFAIASVALAFLLPAELLIASAVQWAERIVRKIDGVADGLR